MKNKINHLSLNKEQEKAAFCEENAVVAAGAGSGKTMVLANRFVWLLTEKGYKVDEILTLTFTKKAAAQMFKRIHSLVSEIADNETGIKAKRAKEALDNFIHSRIQTLDSYSTSIVKHCAPRYGISPDFKIDPERCRELALETAYPFLIKHRHHPAMERLYTFNRPDTIARNIFANILFRYCRIDKPRDFTDDVKIQLSCLYSKWDEICGKTKVIIDQLENDINENNELLPVLVPVMKKYGLKKPEVPVSSDIQNYLNILLETPQEHYIEKAESHPLQNSITEYLNLLNNISSLNLTKGKRSDNPVKENIKLLRSNMNHILPLAISCIQAGFILSIMCLLKELQADYLNRKRAEGVLTFQDIAYLSRTILIEQHDIRQSEKESFKAIMIDEFQDNNELQKDILFLLAEDLNKKSETIPKPEDLCGGKLFFVGDEKQSIYLFRGADVSVFRRLKEQLKSSELPLRINYRSSPDLIGAFNAIFGGSIFDPTGKAALNNNASIFAPNSPSLPPFEASYTPLEAGNNNKGKLTIAVLNSHKNEDDEDTRLGADENEARYVAEKIKQLLDEKKYAPHEIAILLRTTTPQYHFEKHLRALGIPYASEKINDLFYGGPVNDIMSVLRLAAHPLDSASYAEMLRSPFAGLSLPGTALCLSFLNTDNGSAVPFDDKPLGYLDSHDREKYLSGQKIYSAICKKVETETISSLVSELWYVSGYRYETEWNPQTRVYREIYDYLFHLAAATDAENQNLVSFTDSIRTLREYERTILSDIEIPLERPSAVHLMTIHKSKGLEFPAVFLCCCGKKSRTDITDIVYYSEKTGIAFSPPPPYQLREISGRRNNFFWEQASELEKQKRTAELRRLLYVGMTRAENELYITGSLNIKDESEEGDFSLVIKDHIKKQCEKKENYIEGDSIINNDTFFGLLLPSIVSHIGGELSEDTNFFNLEKIPVFAESQDIENKNYRNDQTGLNEFIEKTEPFYEKAGVIQTPVLCNNHITPVSLQNTGKYSTDGELKNNLHESGFSINRDFSGHSCSDIFLKVDSLLAHFSRVKDETSKGFNPGEFGTIAHVCVEALLNEEEPVIPANIACLLTPSQLTSFLEAGRELASRFIISPLGKMAKKANLRENEFSFRSIIKSGEGKEIFINGTVDLFFEDKDTLHIVDFKTDSVEAPEEHTAQMSCYYRAVSDLFTAPLKKKCQIWIYYLRTGHAVEMTEKALKFNLEQKVFSIPL